MRKAMVAAVVVVCLLMASGSARAKQPNHRVLYGTAVAIGASVALGCFISAIALRLKAPNVDTLMTYKRYDDATDSLAIAGGVISVPTLIFTLAGGLSFELGPDTNPKAVSMWLVPAGPGLALGGSF